jgi:hypothetical protein
LHNLLNQWRRWNDEQVSATVYRKPMATPARIIQTTWLPEKAERTMWSEDECEQVCTAPYFMENNRESG